MAEPRGELDAVPALAAPLRITGLGAVADTVLRSPRFAAAMGQGRFTPVAALPTAEALLADQGWDMALIFSPHKRAVATLTDELAPTAVEVGAVDTVVRGGGRSVGFNTNVWSVQQVLESLVRGDTPARVLILGAGPSAQAVVVAARRAWGAQIEIAVSARRRLAPEAVPGATLIAAGDALAWGPTLLVNCTTWGETAESEAAPFVLPFAELLRPGLLFLDLNNRVSELQVQALAAGVTVASGVAIRDAGTGWRAAIAQAGRQDMT